MLPQRLEKYLTEAERQRMQDARIEGRTEGRTEGLLVALIRVIEGRGLAISPADRDRIAGASAEELQQMLGRAALVSTVDQLFA